MCPACSRQILFGTGRQFVGVYLVLWPNFMLYSKPVKDTIYRLYSNIMVIYGLFIYGLILYCIPKKCDKYSFIAATGARSEQKRLEPLRFLGCQEVEARRDLEKRWGNPDQCTMEYEDCAIDGRTGCYPPLLKHGWLENGPFINIVFRKTTSIQFGDSHGFSNHV